MPGSPASSTTAPGTMPPPSTRSSSPTPVGTAAASSTATSPIGRAFWAGMVATVFGADLAAPRSSTLPQVWHSPQRPTHLAYCVPHSVHWYEAAASAFRVRELAVGMRPR